MKAFTVLTRKITPQEYLAVRGTTDWPVIDTGCATRALEKDLFSVCVYDGDRIIGMGRIIGDGAIYFYIQDVVVIPEYQGQGVGSIIMECIEEYLGRRAVKGSFIGLMAARGVKGFYAKFGYRVRPGDRPGMFKTID